MDNKQEDSSRNRRTEYAVESIKQEKKTWDEWSRLTNTRSSIVRGACVSVKADPDIPITKNEFMKAISAFGGKRHGGAK